MSATLPSLSLPYLLVLTGWHSPIFRNLERGGWAEFQDFDLRFHSQDGSLKEDSNWVFWSTQMFDSVRQMGREPHPGPGLERWVRNAGFMNVRCEKFSLPVGSWAEGKRLKEIGMVNLAQLLNGLEAFSLRCFCQVLGWERDEVLDLLEKVRVEIMNRKTHVQLEL